MSMTNLIGIETGTELGTVYINPSQVTHVHEYLGPKMDGEFSVIWLTSGKAITIEGTPDVITSKVLGRR